MAKKEKDLKKRKTIVRKITTRENIALLWIFENREEYAQTGKVNFCFDDFDDVELAKKDKFYFKVTDDEKEIMDDYLNQFVQGASLGAYLGTLKKKGKMPSSFSGSVVSSDNGGQSAAPRKQSKTSAEKELQEAIQNGTFLKRRPGVSANESCPCVNAPVLSDEERYAMEKLDRKPQKKAGTYDEYPFFLNPNEELSVENLDMPMILRMIEQGKIDTHELQELTCLKYNSLYSLPPSAFAGMTDEYLKEQSIANCIIAAEEKYNRVKAIFEEPAPPENETIDRFKTYLQSCLSPVAADEIDKRISTFMDKIYRVDADKIYFETDDDDERDTEELVYLDAEQLKNDLICLCDKYKLDLHTQIDVFGKKTTVYAIVKEFYKKYPNGFNGEFFTTRKEAYLAGKLSV